MNVIPAEQARVDLVRNRTFAVLGYGAQGHAHALNLRDSGCHVLVAQRAESPRHDEAARDGFSPVEFDEAVSSADVLILALPDDALGGIYGEQIEPLLNPGQTLGFLHGFALLYGQVVPPPDVDVVMVAPKAQGRGVRAAFLAGGGAPALIAVHQDASGRARDTALGWAAGIGSHRAALFETTVRDETETDLFGEQAVLCGGLSALIKAGFETLVEAGYPPELAYFECCHEIKLLADLVHDGGITYMRERISSPARFGDLTRGPRIIDDAVKQRMRVVLEEVRSGAFAREAMADAQRGGAQSRALLERDRGHAIEEVGARVRGLISGSEKQRSPAGGDP